MEVTPFKAIHYINTDEEAVAYILEAVLESNPHDRDGMLLELIGHLRQAGALAMRAAAAKWHDTRSSFCLDKAAYGTKDSDFWKRWVGESEFHDHCAAYIRSIDPATLKGE